MTDYLFRKYIDLIRHASSQYVSWHPTVEFKVGAYGSIDRETGEFLVEGNVYDPEFQLELPKHRVKINLADFPPVESPVEENLVIATRTARHKDFPKDRESQVPGITDAAFKGHWEFDRRDRRDAILVLHKARHISFPPEEVLEPLYKIDKLIDKCLITSITVCQAYSMYLSEKSVEAGNTASIALVSKAPEGAADASGGLTWWADTSGGVLRSGYDEAGKFAFTVLCDVKRPIKRTRRYFRDKIRPEPEGDDLWSSESPPWDPLDEEGEEDPLDPDVRIIDPVDPFSSVERIITKTGAISYVLE